MNFMIVSPQFLQELVNIFTQSISAAWYLVTEKFKINVKKKFLNLILFLGCIMGTYYRTHSSN